MSKTREALTRVKTLCEWISETPHTSGSINGLSSQVLHEINEALAEPEQDPAGISKTWFDGEKVVTQHLTQKEVYADPLLKMIAHRARSFPNYPLGYHIPEVFAAVGEAPPEPATEQEIVARQFKHSKTGEWCNFIDEKHYKDTLESGLFQIRSLYTSPQPREWQELSDEDIKSCEWVLDTEEDFAPYVGDSRWVVKGAKEYARLISEKLRAKNEVKA